MRKTLIIAAFGVMAATTSAQAVSVHSGKLNCTIERGMGYFVASSKAVACKYVKNNGRVENYSGRMTVFGADVGITDRVNITWGVSAPANAAPGALAGSYSGLGANAAVGAGGGGQMLVGGSNGVHLSPLGGRMHSGFNVTAGIHNLGLKFDGPVYKGKSGKTHKGKKSTHKNVKSKKAVGEKATGKNTGKTHIKSNVK